MWQKHDLHILETCLWKLKSLSKPTPKLRTLSDGHISLSSNLTGKWLESLCRRCFVPMIINSVLSEFNLRLLDFIHSEMSVRQSLSLDIDLCVPIVIVLCKPCVISMHMTTDVLSSRGTCIRRTPLKPTSYIQRYTTGMAD